MTNYKRPKSEAEKAKARVKIKRLRAALAAAPYCFGTDVKKKQGMLFFMVYAKKEELGRSRTIQVEVVITKAFFGASLAKQKSILLEMMNTSLKV